MRSGRHLWLAGVGAGALISALATAAQAADVNINITGTITGELSATTTGTDKITIVNNGAVINAAGPAIVAKADQGAVAVTNNGVITASQDGILASTGSVDGVSVTLNSGVTAGTGEGAAATDTGAGAATVTVASGTTKAPLTITAGAGTATAGVVAVSYFGAATTTIGDHVAITNGGAGVSGSADAAAVAVLTAADASGPSARVVTGKSDSFVQQGNASAAISAHVGIGGSVGPNGAASASAVVGDNVSMHVSGYSDAGVYVTTTDDTGASKFAGTGNATAIVGTGTILVDEVGATGAPVNSKTSVGVGAFSSGGNVLVDDAAQVTVTGGAETSVGLYASTTQNGTGTVTARNSVTTGSGDAIESLTVNGANTVNVTGGTILATGGDGIDARASGTGSVTVNTAAKSIVGTATPGYSGIFATSGTGAVSVDAEGAISDGGLSARSGNGNVTVVTGSKGVTNTAGMGISATAGQGAVSVTTGGPVTASDQGVLASTSGLGAVTVKIGGSVTSGGSSAVEGISNDVAVGVGPVTVSTASGTGARPIAVTDSNGSGVDAITILGQASTAIGDHNVITAGQSGLSGIVGAAAIAVVTPVDFTGAPSAKVVVGNHDTFVVEGNRGAAITAQTGLPSQLGPSGTASASAAVGNDVDIHVSGYANAGVAAFTSDFSGAGKYASTGAASAVVGTGTITVDEVGASAPPSGFLVNYGVAVGSSGGAVSLDNSAVVTVSGGLDGSIGLSALTAGSGAATVYSRASVTSANGDAIHAGTFNGAVTVNVTAGQLVSTWGDGIDATANGAGAVTVTTAVGTDVRTLTPGTVVGYVGILAQGSGGSVTINSGGVVSDGGIVAETSGVGSVAVNTSGAVTNTNGDGVFASTSGLGAVKLTIGGSVTASGAIAVEGISNDPAVGVGPVTVSTASGTGAHPIAITDPNGAGVEAITILGAAQTTIGDHNVITVGHSGLASVVGADAIAVVTPVDFTGVPSAQTVVGDHDTFVVQGNRGSAVTAQTGLGGNVGPSGTASAAATVGDDIDIHVSGYGDAGVAAFTSDFSGAAKYASKGAASVVVGTGTITVDEVGASSPAPGSMINYGVAVGSTGGNVLIDNSAVVTVSGGLDASIGLSALTAGPGSATIYSRASVTSANGDAIHAASDGGAVSVTVTAGKVASTGGDGIDAVANGAGAVTVGTAAGSSVRTLTPGAFSGILAQSNGGSVTVNAGGVVADGGIVAQTLGAGAVTVSTADAVTNTNGDGVYAFTSGTGAVNVTSTGVIKASGDGIVAWGGGAATAQDSGSMTVGGQFGIIAQSNGSAEALAMTTDGTDTNRIAIRGATHVGVSAFDVGGLAMAQVGQDNTIVAGAPGLSAVAAVAATSLSPANTTTAIAFVGQNSTLAVQGNQSAGVSVINESSVLFGQGAAAANLTNGVNIHVSGLDDAGVFGTVFDVSGANKYLGAGAVTLSVGTGQIVVDENGATGTAAGAATNIGIGAFSLGGTVEITNAADIRVSGGVDATIGIETYTQGPMPNAYSAVYDAGTIVSRQGDGIVTKTTDGDNLVWQAGGSISAPQGRGIAALTTGAGNVMISIGAGSVISGQSGIVATSGTGQLTLTNNGEIDGGTGGGVSLSDNGQIKLVNGAGALITAQGGTASATVQASGALPLIVTNDGTLTTRNASHAGLVLVTGTGGTTFVNAADGVFDGRFTGADNVRIENDGLWQTRGTSNFGTTAGGYSNSFTNLGVLQVGQTGPTASASSFVNVGYFYNGSAGATGIVSMVNGKEGDVFNVSGVFNGAPGHSVLALDAFLGGPGSKADQLRLSSGSAGQTMIRINDTNPGEGALNAKGIVLVQGATAAGDFILDPSQPNYDSTLHGIQHGLFVFPLTFVGGNEELIGVPGLPAAQFATMASAAEQVWSSTSPGSDAADSLRLSLSGSGEAPRVWGKALNWGASRMAAGQLSLGADGTLNSLQAGGDRPMTSSVSQSASVSAFGQTYGFNTSYSQSTSALVAGFDLGRRVGQNSAWSWGLSTGYVESQQSFAQGSSAALYDGAMVAAHGAYVARGGFYLSGDVKMTALKVTYLTSWAGMGRQTGNITTFGGEAQAGWRRSLNATWTVQPEASLAVQGSRLGTLVISDTPLNFGQASSARVSVGARLEGGWSLGGWSLRSSTSLKAVDELQDANTLRLQAIDTGYVLPDQIGGAFADLGQSVSVDRADGRVSAFFSGAYRVKPGYQAAQAAVGLKLRW